MIDSGGGTLGWCQFKVKIIDLKQDQSPLDRFFNDHEKTIFHIDFCNEEFTLNWSEGDLSITCPDSVFEYEYKTLLRQTRFNDIKINYTRCP